MVLSAERVPGVGVGVGGGAAAVLLPPVPGQAARPELPEPASPGRDEGTRKR